MKKGNAKNFRDKKIIILGWTFYTKFDLLKYENYCDEEGWIFNGEIITKANIAGNGTFEGCIEVSGLYSAKIYYDNVKLADSIPSEGTYGVEIKDSARAEVPYTLYFEKL